MLSIWRRIFRHLQSTSRDARRESRFHIHRPKVSPHALHARGKILVLQWLKELVALNDNSWLMCWSLYASHRALVVRFERVANTQEKYAK